MKWKNIVPSQQQAVKLVCMPRATLDDGERKLCGSEQGCLNILPQRPVLMMLYIVSCIIMQPDRNGWTGSQIIDLLSLGCDIV
jgi:hypothetical protein